jgi:hypothetical protein
MVIVSPRVKEQLRTLKKIPYNSIKQKPAGVVDIAIGQLKPHDLARALFVATNAFAELTHKQQVIMKVLADTTQGIKQLVSDSPEFTKEEIIRKIQEVTLEPSTHVRA